jgi:putative ABC transport system substrate-binding protein
MTGFINVEVEMAGKWLQLLTEIAPGVKRAAIMFNPDTTSGGGSNYLRSFEAAARSLNVVPIAAPVHNDAEIETVITSLGRAPAGGLVEGPDSFVRVHSASIISLAAQNNVPAIYVTRFWVGNGGLISYGPDFRDISRRAASYVSRILRGERPGDPQVQLPTKFEMAVNLKTARALGLTVPQSAIDSAERRRGDRMIRRTFIAGLERGGVAARGTSAAASGAGDRVRQPRVGRRL